MNIACRAITSLTLACFAGTALAEETVYVSGLLHQSVGGATLGPVDGRRLPVHNLGSSGQDGVEIQLNSTTGGTVGIDLQDFLNTPGAELRTRPRGWDGLIYGTHRMVSSGTGTATHVLDFSELNPSMINVQILDENGTVISNNNYPGPVLNAPWVPANFCADGSAPVYWEGWVILCSNGCNPVWSCGWACPNSGNVYGYNNRIIVTPQSGPGTPPVTGTGAMVLTASGVPSITLSDATLNTFGLHSWGIGQAQITEECTPDATGGCDPTVRRLPVRNLGSSGEDGVAIDLGPDAGGVEVQMVKGCCRGHVTLMKAYDDGGQEQRISRTIADVDPVGNTEEIIDADFSGLGSGGFLLTCYGTGGTVLGPGGGTAIINGGPRPVWTNRCPNGGTEIWINTGTTSNPVWTFQGCDINTNRMTFPDGTVIDGVASFSITPMGSTHQGKLRHVVITKNGSELELRGVTTIPPQAQCGTADFNGDGDIGTDQDIESFFACLAGSCCQTCGSADFNADGDLGTDADIESFFRVLSGGPC